MNPKVISGFSKLSKAEKIDWIAKNFITKNTADVTAIFDTFLCADSDTQRIIDGFSENTVSNFHLPYGVAPNFVINDKTYCVPMVIEESSVVAAASSAAKYWLTRGGFHAQVLATTKIGQVHFSWTGDFTRLLLAFDELKKILLSQSAPLVSNMEQRGGGIRNIELLDMSDLEADYYQLRVSFETCDSMGANLINSVLESFGKTMVEFFQNSQFFSENEKTVTILMAILSNYTPDCLVRAWVECPIDQLGTKSAPDVNLLAQKFYKAVQIATIDPYRATTHNKGIYNGVDAVVLATGNDFRAIEACGHTYAARDGQYRSLSRCSIENGIFRFWIDLPLAVGTVGGLTKLHPLAKFSLEMLGNPSAKELMQIIAVVGLAQNFAAIKSLVTTGIQQGHMKMHLGNILLNFQASGQECDMAQKHFAENAITFSAVREYLEALRKSDL